jgi:alginate O-acetyltransferase complex protein AlgI
MLFNTIDFIVFFFLVITTLVLIKNRKFQHSFLLFASYFFFYYSSNYLIILLVFSTILDFYVGKAIWKNTDVVKKKLLLSISLAGNLGLLGFFKYSDFAIAQFNILGNYIDLSNDIPFLDIALPIGISFYTFQTISYTVDVYRGKLEPSTSLREFAIFVSFFPQLVAGPILRAKDFLPQLREKLDNFENNVRMRQILILKNNKNLKFGITLIAFGFFKKMFFADNISPLVDDIFSNPIGAESFTIILGAIAFGIQIYGDFSGYSDIAIGAAMILGFKIPINFNKPYFATSPSDFWRRWHISLSSWLRDYLYIPLGGNKKSHGRTYLNLFTVMFLGGLWHGASWNFVVWGILHGLYLAIHKLLKKIFPSLATHPFFKSTTGKIFCIGITQYFVFLTWIPFRVSDTDQMIYSMYKFIILDFQTVNTINTIISHEIAFSLIILFIILHLISYKTKNLIEKLSNLKTQYWLGFLIIVISLILLSYAGTPEQFIYFKF